MKAAMIVAAREVREKARLFWICAALALVPFAATLLPGTSGQSADTIAVVGRFLSATLGLGIAVTFGVSTVVRDLAERRMSFYFTKPVSSSALWAGKATAALFASLACFAVIAVPAMLASHREYVVTNVQWLVAGAVAIVVLFFGAHVLSTVIRSRSPLLALDFVFLSVALAAVYLIVRPLILGAAVQLVACLQIAIGVAVVVVLAIAPVWQLANGRSDIRRSHAALMRFLWPAIAIVLLIAGGVVAWLVHVSPEDVEVAHIDQPSRGAQVIVTGTAPHRLDYQSTFLIDRVTGRFTRIASPPWWGSQFSSDGRVAVWLQPVGTFLLKELELYTAKGPTGIVLPPYAQFVLSDDGTRVAIVNGQLLAVHDIGSGKLLASAAGLDGRARQQVFFVNRDLVRVIEHEHRIRTATPLRVFELDVRARATRKTGERVVETTRTPVSVSGDGSRMLIRGANVIADGRTAETIATIDTRNVTHSEMLYDGRVAAITLDDRMPHLRTFERDGTPRHVVAFPNTRTIWIAGETENGKLILAAYGKTMYVVDLARGAIEQRLDGIRGPVPRWSADPRLMRYGADQELVGIDAKGRLVAWKNIGRASARPLLHSR